MSPDREHELVERSREDGAAFAELYDAYLPRIYAFSYRRVRERSAAEDLTATTFQRALKTVRNSDLRNESFGGWLYRIATTAIAERTRRGQRPSPIADTDPTGQNGQNDLALDSFALAVDREQLRRAVLAIPGEQRSLLVLRCYDDLDNAELCAVLGCDAETLAARLQGAIGAVRLVISGRSPDAAADDTEVAQINDLAHELGDAGRLARIVSAHREQPDPVFSRNLRDELAGVSTHVGGSAATIAPTSRSKAGTVQPVDAAVVVPPPSGPFPGPVPGPANQPAAVPPPPVAAESAAVETYPAGAATARVPTVPPPPDAQADEAPPAGAPGATAVPPAAVSPARSQTGSSLTKLRANNPFGLTPEWPPVPTRSSDAQPGIVPTPPVPAAGALDSQDVDEASIEAFYKWAAKARAAGRAGASTDELSAAGNHPPVAAPEPPAPEPQPAIETADKPRPAAGHEPKAPRRRIRGPHIAGKWVVAALSAVVVVAVAAYGIQLFMTPAIAGATAPEAVSATLIRDGARTTLTTYQSLKVGDEIQVAAGGHVSLTINDSRLRLAAAADLKLVSLAQGHIVVDQLAGEVYYRVSVPAGGDYSVTTGSVTWVAHGTAFDVSRSPRASAAGDEVVALALVDGFEIQGAEAGRTQQLKEGMSATVQLTSTGASDGQTVTGVIPAAVLANAWISENANLDAQQELPMGVLIANAAESEAAGATATPVPSSSEARSPSPSPSPTPTQSPTPTATAKPTATPTPTATPKPTPTRTTTPAPAKTPVNLGTLRWSNEGKGVYTCTWNAYPGTWDGSTEYRLVYLLGASGTPSYPGSNYWPGGLSTDAGTTSFVLNAADLQAPGTASYRVRLQAVRAGTVLASTGTITVTVTTPAPPAAA